jgi:hypothetical protein
MSDPRIQVGSPAWIFDYRSKAPHNEKWRPAEVVGETDLNWLVTRKEQADHYRYRPEVDPTTYSCKVPKGAEDKVHKGIALLWELVDTDIWNQYHREAIASRVKCVPLHTLKKVAGLVGYDL